LVATFTIGPVADDGPVAGVFESYHVIRMELSGD
jgi:hypothetical protein